MSRQTAAVACLAALAGAFGTLQRQQAAAPSCTPGSFVTGAGWDLNNGDLPGQPVSKTLSTAAQCAALCCSTAGCAAYSLNAGAAGSRWCYLKAGGWQNMTSPGVESGLLAPDFSGPWWSASLPVAQRVSELVAAMTVDEQISWLNDASPAIPRLGLPAYSWEAEAAHGVAWNGIATVFPAPITLGATWDVPLASRVGSVIAVEARAKWLAGLGAFGSTVEFAGLSFMVPNNNVAVDPRWGRLQETWGEDVTLASALTGALVRAVQFDDDCTFGCTNYTKIIATSKHAFAYHIDSLGNDGQARLSHSWNITPADMQQTYLPTFAAAVNAGVSAVMCAYDGWNCTSPQCTQPLSNPSGAEPWGVPACLHPQLDQLLRGQLGFDGYVITDEGAITFSGPGYHDYAPSVTEAACLALNAGSDLALGSEFAGTLRACLDAGNVTAARIAQALTRTLTQQFRLGWFDSLYARVKGLPDPVPYNTLTMANVSSPAHRALALEAALEGLTLLKNAPVGAAKQPALPLRADGIKRLAVIGPAATFGFDYRSSYLSNYAGCLLGANGDFVTDPRCHVVDLREALANASAANGFTLSYAPGCPFTAVNTSGIATAVAAAQGADAIVMALGLDAGFAGDGGAEGEANDRGRGSYSAAPTLDLPGSQLQLLNAVAAARAPGVPLIVVLMNGGPISSTLYGTADAVLEAWYGGYEAGNAVSQALFGAYSPAGRLPVTIVADEGELPPPDDFSMTAPPGRTARYYTGAPTYPLGFGLSYATFSYTGLGVQPSPLLPADASFSVTVTLRNTGAVASDEVAQLWGMFAPADGVTGGMSAFPRQQLLAFQRIKALAPGASLPVSFTVARSSLALMDPLGVMRVISGTWRLTVGGGPPNNADYAGGGAVLTAQLAVVGDAA